MLNKIPFFAAHYEGHAAAAALERPHGENGAEAEEPFVRARRNGNGDTDADADNNAS